MRPLLRLPLAVQTQYAELLDQLLLDAASGPSLRAGSLVNKTIRDRKYWYLQFRDAAKQKQVYLGPDGPDLEPLLARLRSELETARGRASDRAALVAMASSGGAYAVAAAEARVLQLLARAGLFRVGGVLLGTYAFAVFGNMLGVRWAGATVRTQDIDVGHDEHIAIALASDLGGADLEAARKDRATGLELWPVPSFDPRRPSTSFSVLGTELRVDLLTPMRGREREAPVKIAALGAAAQPLRFLDYVLEDTQPAAVIGGDGVLVNVPSPARFALHKLLVAQRRPVSHAAKSRKDLAQAEHVLAVLLQDRPDDVRRAYADLAKRGGGWVKPVRASIARLAEDVRRALETRLGAA
jgi:hypothetical protein